MTEQVLPIDCRGERLPGVLALPDGPAPRTAILIVVGGPQYRAGAHRQFVLLARALAAAGHAALRFDVRGMGDATGEARPFEALDDDIGAAIEALAARLPTVRQVVLWGLCDGASAALLYCQRRADPLVRGLCLANPWVRSAQTLARTRVRHYYLDRLRQRAFWTKLFSGRVAVSALAELWRNLLAARRGGTDASPAAVAMRYQDRMARAWRGFDGPILLLLSGRDYTAKEFVEALDRDPAWAGARQHPRLTVHELAQADHTFSATPAREQCEALTVDWLAAALGATVPPVTTPSAVAAMLQEGAT
jgi:exosortase A-associated hydrolase 1